ncbi:MAG: STAS/SEC14 domain-containing protein [Reyranella sp.]|uniref:STAS/SEC14 domain-containing protein n=1 Tax=Reyranella sp. TaxID=1929291 RepID=UPI00272F1647|nr:STAS/SEC14 domain-containing protein [Reyranella sp.]MDP1966892.1 STAS/SEC14 domain-containing protein [Reyranella sp.]MDP2375049.1 STAS/SEC14 domain-containing protein [Reyranella sp.]
MPVHWEVDLQQKLVTVVAEGDVTRAEVEAYLEAIGQAGLYGYSKLFDGKRAATHMTSEEILSLGARMRALHAEGHQMGALAAVVPEGQVEAVSRVLGMLAAADRPMRVFRQIGPARKWIRSLPG